MAQTAESGSANLNGPSANQETTSQGIEGVTTEISQVKTVHFGCFNDRIQAEVQNLQTGLSTLDGAIMRVNQAVQEVSKDS